MKAIVRFEFDKKTDLENWKEIDEYMEFMQIKYGNGGLGEEYANCYAVNNIIKFNDSIYEYKITKILTQNGFNEILIDITLETLV